MSPSVEFRTIDQEVEKLLEECQMLRAALKEISAQISRMENRARRAFPAASTRVGAGRLRIRRAEASLTSEQALAEFESAVRLANTDPSGAERFLANKTTADLVAMARELGISFGKSKPSRKAVQNALYGKIRESLLLSKHNTARNPAA
jgi:hypothetical protein